MKITYAHHAPWRRGLHVLLAATRLDGDLFLAGRNGEPGAEQGKAVQAT